MKIRKYLWGVIYGLILTAFTAYILLDTFVIARVYTPSAMDDDSQTGNTEQEKNDNEYFDGNTQQEKDDNEILAENDTDSGGEQSVEITGTTYKDGNIVITVTEYREKDTSIYVADIQVSSAEYLKTAFAQNAYGKNVTENTSEIAESNDAILAINGDFYGVREKGYVLRNGVLYRTLASGSQEDLVIYEDGSFSIITETDVSAEQLLSDGAEQILSFGPALIVDGTIAVSRGEEVGRAKASNPRTAIGVIDELHYLFVVSDGRTDESQGLTLYELAEFMQSLGADMAYNLDGGGSTTMYFNGNVINNPTSSGRHIEERSVSDIVYIGY